MAGSERISPTAHYTSYVWYRAGISHSALASPLGALLHLALRPMNLAYEWTSRQPSLDQMLLARHRVLDCMLEREIDAGRVGQVLEIAAGLSPRGITLSTRHPDLLYVEADLPHMAAEKLRRLRSAGARAPKHHVVEIDALAQSGPASLLAVAETQLDPGVGTAIVTEGLLGYFERAAVDAMWRRFAAVLSRFPTGVYLADVHLRGEVDGMRGAGAFRLLLSLFARGRVHLHFERVADVETALRAAGFAEARVHQPAAFPGAGVPAAAREQGVRLVEARTTRRRSGPPAAG